jgi:hypothetical protein
MENHEEIFGRLMNYLETEKQFENVDYADDMLFGFEFYLSFENGNYFLSLNDEIETSACINVAIIIHDFLKNNFDIEVIIAECFYELETEEIVYETEYFKEIHGISNSSILN